MFSKKAFARSPIFLNLSLLLACAAATAEKGPHDAANSLRSGEVDTECLFGSSFRELLDGLSSVTVAGDTEMTSVENLEPLTREQLVLAVQQSSHTDVRTPEEAISRVDQQRVRLLGLWDVEGSRAFTAFEYGVGDNSYGAIFERGTTTIVASIHDGDFLGCSVQPGRCLFGPTFRDLAESGAFELRRTLVIRKANLAMLSSAETAQLHETLRQTYGNELDLPSALASADRGEVNQFTFRVVATGATIVAYEHGAGDTSVGALFDGESTTAVAVISDGAIEQCRLFATLGATAKSRFRPFK
jgi:hypothetical protein